LVAVLAVQGSEMLRSNRLNEVPCHDVVTYGQLTVALATTTPRLNAKAPLYPFAVGEALLGDLLAHHPE
jgi:hypothetical protein